MDGGQPAAGDVRVWRDGLRMVLRLVDELGRCSDLDTLYRTAVELARERLGIERCAYYWLDGECARGTWGTDQYGQTTDERAHGFPRSALAGSWHGPPSVDTEPWVRVDGRHWTLIEDHMVAIGEGWQGFTRVGAGERDLGVFINDAAITGAPCDPLRQDLLACFCAHLGALIERRRSEAALQAAAQRTRAMLEALPDLVFRLDREGRYREWTAPDPGLLYVQPSEFLGRRLEEILPAEAAVPAQAALAAALTNRHAPPVEYRLTLPDGPRDFELRMRACGEDEVIAVVRDVTDRRALEEQLRQAVKMEAVGKLAGGIAHDYNNLLTTILGYSDLLLAGVARGERSHADLLEIKKAGERAAHLTQQLLTFSHKQMRQSTILDLGAAVEDMREMVARVVGDDITVHYFRGPGAALVRADLHQLQQVVLNLVVNACEAMPTGGILTLAVESVHVGPVEAARSGPIEPGSYVRLTVGDTGRGIAPDVLPRIFEPFFTTKEVGQGSGLGLATSYGIARQSGGCIEVESAPGLGSRFRVLLPKSSERVPVSTELPEQEITALAHETILLVEDEPSVRELARRVLEGLGYRVLAAGSGEQALRLAAGGTHVDLLLTDLVMPGMSGWELVARLVAPRPRTLFMSGHDEKVVALAGAGLATERVLHKPFTRLELGRAVRAALETPAECRAAD